MYSSSSLILKFIVLFLYVNTLFLKGSILRILNSVIYFTVCLINPIPGSFAPLIQLFTQMVRLPVVLFSWLLAVLTISRFSLRDICLYSLRLWCGWYVCIRFFQAPEDTFTLKDCWQPLWATWMTGLLSANAVLWFVKNKWRSFLSHEPHASFKTGNFYSVFFQFIL